MIEWTLDQYDPDYYKNSPAVNPWNQATNRILMSLAAALGTDDPKLRAGRPAALGRLMEIQDPQLPKSVWYHTDAQFLGFRIVRPLDVPAADAMQKYWNSGVEKDIPGLTKAE